MTGKDTNKLTPPPPAADPSPSADGAAENKSVLSEHKGKLAMGVAATLGLMIYYNWRQKNLPKDDPEAYARLQRLKDSLKNSDGADEHGHHPKHRKPPAGKTPAE